MVSSGKYLYCIIRCSEERGFDDVAPVGCPGPVSTVPCDGLAAVVSDSPTSEYPTTRSNMLAHQRVQERAMREFTLLPVRFGTVASSLSPGEDIRRLLSKRAQEFDRLLAEMEGKAEVGLKALWRDEKALFQEILAENEAIRRARSSLAGKSPEVIRFQGIALGEAVKGALERKRAREAAAILAPLRRIACNVRESDILVDRMILNAAFLVERAGGEAFDQAVTKLDRELGHRVLLRYVGPVPPYNFVNIVVNWEEV